MLGPLFNRIKLCFEHPKKNMELAGKTMNPGEKEQDDIKNFVFFLGEQVLPQWCAKMLREDKSGASIQEMHNLVFLFAYKTAQVFQGRVIH